MTEFLAALVGALVGGGFTLLGTSVTARRAQRAAMDSLFHAKKVDALEQMSIKLRHAIMRSSANDDYNSEEWDGAITRVKAYAPNSSAFAVACWSALRDLRANRLAGEDGYREEEIVRLKHDEFELAMQFDLHLPALDERLDAFIRRIVERERTDLEQISVHGAVYRPKPERPARFARLKNLLPNRRAK